MRPREARRWCAAERWPPLPLELERLSALSPALERRPGLDHERKSMMTNRPLERARALAIAVLGCIPFSASAQSLTGVGALQPGWNTQARGVNGDGSAVVGDSEEYPT